MTPTFKIIAGGSDVTGDISARLISLDITDTVDETSDSMTLSLADALGELALPASGAKLEVSIGYDGNNQHMGSFVVDEATVEGPPDVITVQASSTPFVSDRGGGGNASFTSRKSRSWEDKKLGEIIQTIAGECGLEAKVDKDLEQVQVPYIAQTAESDANLLIRLARTYGGVVKPADGKLVFASEDGGKSISGQSMEVTITPDMVTSWQFKQGGKLQGVTKVKAKKHDYSKAALDEYEVDIEDPE